MRGDSPPRSAAEFLQSLERPQEAEASDSTIEVVAPNWNTVAVYCCCAWDVLATMGGAYYTGISATEIRSALLLNRIARAEWAHIARGIQRVMVPAARKNLNGTKG